MPRRKKRTVKKAQLRIVEENPEFPITPSPYDPRDYKYEQRHQLNVSSNPTIANMSTVNNLGQVQLPLPETLDLRSKMLTPRNQGKRGTCAAFSAAAIREYQERIDINLWDYISPEFIYFYRENKPNSGMYPRNVMKILQKYGSVPEKLLPYTSTEATEIPEECTIEADKHKIKEYSIISTVQGLKDALCRYGPCLIAFPVYSTRPEFWRPANANDPKTGGHAVCIVGYNKDGFIIRNSWGPMWNMNGHVLYPYSEFGSHWEIWCCTDIESDEWLSEPSTVSKCALCLKAFK